MSSTVLLTIISLSFLGLISAIILYFIAQKFKVFEDPRIDEVQAALPAVNCGGCGFPGCRNFAEALVKADSFEGLNCPVGGNEVMSKAAQILGKETVVVDPLVAVVLCQGSPVHRPQTSKYNGVPDCRIAHQLYIGETDCSFGCLSFGDCVKVCTFDAIYMDKTTDLPVIIDEKCVACGLCVRACPRNIIELRKKAKKDRKLFVSCINKDKGGPARRACKVACTSCNKCYNVCEFGAITIENNLAYIDAYKCTFCRKCVEECPTKAILEFNFPPRKPKAEIIEEKITT
ncbi:MAG: ferredoxin [Odoribacter sp.]|nr:ferredoxin [Odoribacter sp.]